MDGLLAYCNQTQGRDKLYRITQYGSKLLGWWVVQHSNDKDLVDHLLKLEKTMSTSRKLFRFGRSIESFRAAQRAINLQNTVLQWTLTASHGNKALYLLIDHYVWLGRVGLLQANLKKWGNVASKFYLASLICAFLRDLYSLYVDAERCLQNAKFEGKELERPKAKLGFLLFVRVIQKNPQATLDCIKNGCDIVIPLSSLGYLGVNNGVVGACGVISSLIGAYQIAKPSIKLRP